MYYCFPAVFKSSIYNIHYVSGYLEDLDTVLSLSHPSISAKTLQKSSSLIGSAQISLATYIGTKLF